VLKNLFSIFRKKNRPESNPGEKTIPTTIKSIVTKEITSPLLNIHHDLDDSTSIRNNPKQIVYGVGYDIGQNRTKNEDSIFAQSAILATQSTELPFGLFIIADGMGGHKNGEVASDQAIRTMSNYVQDKLHASLYGPEPVPPSESLQEIMSEGVRLANKSVLKNATDGGTTLTSALLLGSQLTISHIGDSRAYNIFLDGRIESLTTDHSLVQRLIQLGQITEEEAEVHPQRSMLYRALGQVDLPKADIINSTMPSPGYVMICSDGLWGVLSDDQIYQIVISASSLNRACQNMVDAANNAGGPDNISVILFTMTD
jgi:PPM family protein phosphatase